MIDFDRRRKSIPSGGLRWFAEYALAWSVLWWLLSHGQVASWLVGGPTVLAAAGVSAWLAPRWGWHWTVVGAIRFGWHFGRASLAGGIDVAWRALHPQLPIDPQMIEYQLRLPPGTAQVFFANAVSLCPGTVSATMREGVLGIHVLDARQPARARLAELEQTVADLFDVALQHRDASADEEIGGAT